MKKLRDADSLGIIIMIITALLAGILIGCGVTLFCVVKENRFWEVDKMQNEIRLEMGTIDMERIDLENLLTTLEAYGMEINTVLIRKDGEDFLKFKLGEVK